MRVSLKKTPLKLDRGGDGLSVSGALGLKILRKKYLCMLHYSMSVFLKKVFTFDAVPLMRVHFDQRLLASAQ